MRQKLKPDEFVYGWGEPVHPLVRLAATIIGIVGILSLALSALLIYFGKRDLQMNVENAFDWIWSGLMAWFGVLVAISGKAPGKSVPKKSEE